MIANYKPDYKNQHTVRITLNDEGYVGHINLPIGGNCKGMSILESALSWLENGDMDDLNTGSNDCELDMIYPDEDDDEDVVRFSFVLSNGEDKRVYDDYTDEEFQHLVVAVEIIECIPEYD